MDKTDKKKRIEIFCCYAREDQSLLVDLKKHLTLWERQGLITVWADTDIAPGTSWETAIAQHLKTAHIILLLVSPDFLASEYCYSTEMMSAMERYDHGEVCVLPIILRHCAWKETPFGNIQALPANAEPIVSSRWHTQDEAFADVVRGIQHVVEMLQKQPGETPTAFSGAKQGIITRRTTILLGMAALGTVAAGVVGLALAPSSPLHIALLPTFLPVTPTPLPGTTLYIYRGHSIAHLITSNAVRGVSWSPNGRRIASAGSDKTVQVWDATNGGNVFTYQGHSDSVVDVVWSPSGKRITSGSDDRTVQLWDATNGGNVFTYQGHTNAVYAVAWSPDGSRIASAGEDSTVQVWNAE